MECGSRAAAFTVTAMRMSQRREPGSRTPQNHFSYSPMLVREYRESDLEALRRIHAAQQFPYAFPDLDNPLFLTKIVLTDEDVVPGGACPDPVGSPAISDATSSGKEAALKGGTTKARTGHILGAALLRLTAEAYLLLDPRQDS